MGNQQPEKVLAEDLDDAIAFQWLGLGVNLGLDVGCVLVDDTVSEELLADLLVDVVLLDARSLNSDLLLEDLDLVFGLSGFGHDPHLLVLELTEKHVFVLG